MTLPLRATSDQGWIKARLLESCPQFATPLGHGVMSHHSQIVELGAATAVVCCAAASWYLHSQRPDLYSKAQRWVSRNAPAWTAKVRKPSNTSFTFPSRPIPSGCWHASSACTHQPARGLVCMMHLTHAHATGLGVRGRRLQALRICSSLGRSPGQQKASLAPLSADRSAQSLNC